MTEDALVGHLSPLSQFPSARAEAMRRSAGLRH
jgi:hypothetical protein